MSNFHVTALHCPDCGSALEGVETDRVFACLDCATAVEIRQGKKHQVPLYFAPVAVATRLPLLYLPFWRTAVRISVRDPEGADVLANTVAAHMDAVWVSAFYEVRPNYHGNPGLDLTAREATLLSEEFPPKGARLPGGRRTWEEAARYTSAYVIDLLDKERDVTGFDISVVPSAPEYWAVPFAYDTVSRTIADLTGGRSYNVAVVENFRAIAAIACPGC